MSGRVYGQSLTGLTLNLLVRDVPAASLFAREVLGAEVVYEDPDFAVYRACGAEWMVHADHTYEPGHPFRDDADTARRRGAGAELRLHGRDPDAAERAAEQLGFTVLARATSKPHGLREAYIVDADGYVWVPGTKA
ncbi:MAG: VOC family protein [Dehalococcoidia bacterium]